MNRQNYVNMNWKCPEDMYKILVTQNSSRENRQGYSCLSIGPMLSMSWNVCLSLCLSVHVFTFEVPFKRLFAPISQKRMSNIFRDPESLGKSNGKKWSQIWTFMFGNGLKLPNKNKYFFLADFALQNMVKTTLPDGLETSGLRAYR